MNNAEQRKARVGKYKFVSAAIIREDRLFRGGVTRKIIGYEQSLWALPGGRIVSSAELEVIANVIGSPVAYY